jgi:oligoribonuclease NrnB/cAMP/cGMP phosphodiesterase (DHH superfamily)
METSKSIISITHKDLDGVGCQLILRHQFQDVHFHTTSYNILKQTLTDLEDLLSYDKSKNLIIISDISMTHIELDKLVHIATMNPLVKFVYADHHIRTQKENAIVKMAPKNFIDVFDDKRCSASILYYYYNINANRLKEIIDLINVYDMWIDDSSMFYDALVLNELYESVDHWDFLNNISNYGKISDYLKNKELKVRDKMNTFVSNIDNNSLIYYDDKICVAHIDRYKSLLQNSLNRPISIIISSNLNFSVRLSNKLKDYEVKDYTELFFKFFESHNITFYHAHRQVFGFNSNGSSVEDQIDELISFIQESIQ